MTFAEGTAGVILHAHQAALPSLPPWCREQYSAERMNLVLLGGEPLDTLQQVGKSGWRGSALVSPQLTCLAAGSLGILPAFACACTARACSVAC